MKTLARVYGPFLVLILSLSQLFSQQVAHNIYFPTELYSLGKESFFIYLDNDKFIPPSLDEDRDYTNGIAFSYSNKGLLNFPLHKINNWLLQEVLNPQSDSNFQFLSPEIKLGSLAYTPRDIAESRLILDDRPYASVHYIEIKSRLWNKQKNQVHSLGISYGVLASPIAEFAQIIIHTIGRIRPVPEGWDNQIAHPWEPTLLMSYQRDRIWRKEKAHSFLDLKESISLDVGFRLMGAYALTGRWGTKVGKRDQGQAFLYLRLKPHALAYDANLEGQFRPSLYTVPRKDIYFFRAEAAAGISFNWDWAKRSLKTGYGFYAQSPEARYPTHTRFHYWGRFWLGWVF
ncbi:MAG: DUF2219 family protein [Bacteroidia bacterium]|nr:DUF2219 family protein [Bacteroidia bacterium]